MSKIHKFTDNSWQCRATILFEDGRKARVAITKSGISIRRGIGPMGGIIAKLNVKDSAEMLNKINADLSNAELYDPKGVGELFLNVEDMGIKTDILAALAVFALCHPTLTAFERGVKIMLSPN